MIRLVMTIAVGCSLAGCAALFVGGAATTVAVATDRRTTGTVIEDQAIELKAGKAISENEELDSQTHINVTSYNRMVLVTGEANSEALRDQVLAIVRGIDEVRHVYDEIRITAPSSVLARSNDTRLTTLVKTRLFATRDIDATNVKVVTEANTVYLMGLLTQDEGDIAADAAAEVGGVTRVVKLFEYQTS